MKVLLFTDIFYPSFFSDGRLLTDLASGLAETCNKVQVLTAFGSYNKTETGTPQEEYLGIQIKRVSLTRLTRSNCIGRLTNEISFCLVAFVQVLSSSKDKMCTPCLVLFSRAGMHILNTQYDSLI